MAMKPLVISERITKRESESFKKYLSEIDKIKQFTPDEEHEVALKAFEGNESAKEELITRNLRFVISVAKQYYNNNGVKLEDLVNEGNLGLIQAAERFDPTQGFKFISYAVWWIRRNIIEYITRNSRTIRIPNNKAQLITKLGNEISIIEQKIGRSVSKEDVFEFLGNDYSESEIDFYLELEKTNTLSLDKKLSDDDDFTLIDKVTNDSIPNPDYYLNKEDNKYQINLLLDNLNKPSYKQVITYLYGLNGEQQLTIKEVANKMGISSERVRQIRDKSIRILKRKNQITNFSYMFEK